MIHRASRIRGSRNVFQFMSFVLSTSCLLPHFMDASCVCFELIDFSLSLASHCLCGYYLCPLVCKWFSVHQITWSCRDHSAVKSIEGLLEDQDPHGSPQPPATPGTGDVTPVLLWGHCIHMAHRHTCTQNTQIFI